MKTINPFFFSIILTAGTAWGQVPWSHKEVHGVIVLEDRIVLATSDGVELLLRGEKSWKPVRTNLPVYAHALMNHGASLFAGTWDGMYTSFDNGLGWTLMCFRDTAVYALVPCGPSGGIVAGTAKGIFVSDDGGTTWIRTEVRTAVFRMAVSGGYFLAAVQDGLVGSGDCGRSWQRLGNPAGLVPESMVGTPTGFMVSTTRRVFRSTDRGKTWGIADTLSIDPYLTASNDGEVYLSSGMSVEFPPHAVLKSSTDLGLTWGVSLKTPEGLKLAPVVEKDSALFAVTNRGDVLISRNKGLSWIPAAPVLGDGAVTGVVKIGTSYIAGTLSLGAFHSNDGVSWNHIPLSEQFNQVTSVEREGNKLLVGTLTGHVWTSDDHGTTWQILGSLGSGITDLALHESRLVAAVYQKGIYEYKGEGRGWAAIFEASGLDQSPTSLLVEEIDGTSTILFGTFGSGVFRSTRQGMNWVQSDHGMPDGRVTSLEVTNIPHGQKVFFAATGGGVFRSTDGGSGWTLCSADFPMFGLSAVTTHGPTIVAGAVNGSIVFSDDLGNTWTKFVTDTLFGSVFSLLVDDNRLFVSTLGDGLKVYAFVSSEAGERRLVPTVFALSQNYPNPFNSQTTIQVDIPTRALVTIAVFDITGRLTETLFHGPLEADRHVVYWNAASHASGTYFCRLTADSFVSVKKMVLVK